MADFKLGLRSVVLWIWMHCDVPLLCCVCRMGGQLPEGVIPHRNGTLAFGRPLSLSDQGTYQCVVKNDVGVGSTKVEISVTGRRQHCQAHTQRPVITIHTVRINLDIHLIVILSFTSYTLQQSTKWLRTCWWSLWGLWLGGCWSWCSSLSSPSLATTNGRTRSWRRNWLRRGKLRCLIKIRWD